MARYHDSIRPDFIQKGGNAEMTRELYGVGKMKSFIAEKLGQDSGLVIMLRERGLAALSDEIPLAFLRSKSETNHRQIQ